MKLKTPYYLIDEKKLLKNLKIIKRIKDISGVKTVLALKCFSTWSVFELMKQYLDGTTSSSLYEARLGYEKFGKEVHAYSVAYSKQEIEQVREFADKIIFNSISQLKLFAGLTHKVPLGIRVNPQISYSHFDLADPARKFSRLGVIKKNSLQEISHLIKGLMFHFNCENDDFPNFCLNLDYISTKYSKLLTGVDWVSLGGGFYFTKAGYPIKKFAEKLKEFSQRFQVQVYLEPGESAITQAGQLVTTVLDIVHNKRDIAIVDASIEAHMLDLLVYRINAKIEPQIKQRFKYVIAGRSCLAGDIFGCFGFPGKLKVGSIIKFADAAGYTMVKKNWFNGLQMPSIVVKRLNGTIDLVQQSEYKDFVNSLS
ncbi:MAG: carboxynorspermidine decarboxylase [Candidatus Omnitrophica bacterium]|nr:carboxynorspermidine decarboxylase [Candidatus Omnitrophota bacterium]